MMLRLHLVPILVLGLLLPAQAQWTEWQQVESVEASGSVELTAGGGWMARVSAGEDPEPAGLRVSSDWLRLELDSSHAEPSDPASYLSNGGTTRLLYEGPANITAIAHYSGYEIFTGSKDGSIDWRTPALHARRPARADQVAGTGPATNTTRTHDTYPTDGSAYFTNAAGSMRLHGGFEMRINGVDLQVQTPGGTWNVSTAFRSGAPSLPVPSTPYTDPMPGFPEDYREAWITTRSGTVRLDPPSTGGSLFAYYPTISVTGALQVQDRPSDRLPSETPSARAFKGDFLLGLMSHYQPRRDEAVKDNANLTEGDDSVHLFSWLSSLPAPLAGEDPFALLADPDPPSTDPVPPNQDAGEPLQPLTTTTDAPFLPWVAFGALVAAAAAVAAVLLRRRVLWSRLERSLDLGLDEKVLRDGQRFLRLRRYARRASVLHALALLNVRGAQEAEGFLRSLQPARRPAEGTWNYLMACAQAGQGHAQEARRHLQACLELEPAYASEARRNPRLSGILSDAQQGYG